MMFYRLRHQRSQSLWGGADLAPAAIRAARDADELIRCAIFRGTIASIFLRFAFRRVAYVFPLGFRETRESHARFASWVT